MDELEQIEELFKSEEFIKSRALVHSLLRHAAKYHDKSSSPEEKQTALNHIKAISQGKKFKEPKAPKKPAAKVPFHEEFVQHHGGDATKFKAAFDAMSPEQQKVTQTWHKQQVANKLKKSIDNLYELFVALKKHT